MRAKLTTCVLAGLMFAYSSAAAGPSELRYGWTISNSNVDAFQNTGPSIPAAPGNLYLWLQCSPDGGMSAAEFDLVTPPGVTNFGFTPTNGFLNAGSGSALLLAVGGCPTGDVLAGSWGFFPLAAGDYCLVPSALSDTRGTVDCSSNPDVWPISFKGFGADAAAACTDVALCTSPVSATSWGAVKSLYR